MLPDFKSESKVESFSSHKMLKGIVSSLPNISPQPNPTQKT